MSVAVKPVEQLELKGICTAGNPIQRPRGTAEICSNFRVMPGNWLRLRSGLTPWYNTTGVVRQICPFRTVDYPGSTNQLAQLVFGSATAYWHWFSLLTYVIAPAGFPGVTEIESIATAYDGAFALTKPAAFCNLDDRPVMYNGLGVRDGTNSRPPFSHYKTGIRYFGLDAYCVGGNPVAAFTSDSGYNQVQTSVDIYVGLYNSATEHYSNGVLAGTIAGTEGTGTINVTNLGRLKYATHNASETAELYYVFYATIDNGEVPYLILNSTLDGPHKVAVTEGSASLSVASGTVNGWDLDLTKEMPTENFPPRPMRSICYVNGRIYGALMSGGYGSGTDFSYIPTARELAAVCWSAAASDSVEAELLGDPLQCWPLFNILYTPSGDQPVVVAPAPDGTRVLVITPTSTFVIDEQADGIHIPYTVSRVHGITNASTLAVTPYGICWVTQRNQFVLLESDSSNQSGYRLKILSGDYQSVIVGTPQCADYVLDPVNEVDRYQVWFSGGLSVCHDFGIGGQAYTLTCQTMTAAASPIDSDGKLHHIVANTALYTHEGHPTTGLVPTLDATFTTGQSYATYEITGIYQRNWDDFGDSDVRKEMPMLDVTGDGDTSTLLARSPLVIDWWGDFEETSEANKKTSTGARVVQSSTIDTFRYKMAAAKKFWYKFRFTLTGHSTDDATFATYPNPATEGGLAKNFYASILRVLWRLGIATNRA